MLSQKLHSGNTKMGNSAFTLIELLVVIAIIALLVSILLPSLTKAKELAKRAVCMSQQKQIDLAFMSYANDYDGILPPYGGNYPSQSSPYWFQLIGSYVGVDWTTHTVGVNYMRCPTDSPSAYAARADYYTYGVNYGQVFNYLSVNGTPYPPRNVSQLSSSTFLLADAESSEIYIPINQWALKDDPLDDGFSTSCNMIPPYYNCLSPRHDNAAVFSFADGSVRIESLRNWATNANLMWGGEDF